MKKRIFALLLIAAMSFSLLAGCGSKDDDKTPETNNPETSAPTENQDPSFGADLTEFYNKIMAAAVEGPFMMDIGAEPEFMENYYPGLKDIETKQLVAYTPAMTGVAVEFVFVEVANAADVDAVKAILQARIDDQKTEGMGKYPTTTVVWEKHSEIVAIDNYVCLFVCTDKDGMIEAFRNGTEVPAWAKPQAPTEGEGDIEGGIMDMPVVDGPAAYDPEADVPAFDPEAETSTAPVAPPADLDHDIKVEDSTPAVNPETPATSSVDLDAFYNELYAELYPLDAEGFGTGPMAIDLTVDNSDLGIPAADGLAMLDMYFPGLTAIEANQLHVFFCPMSFSAYEVVLVEVSNAADVETVKGILQARIDAQADGGAWYQEAVDGWINDSRIVTNGNYIMMAVGADCDTFVERFNAQF